MILPSYRRRLIAIRLSRRRGGDPKLGLEYHGRSYRINIVDLEDSKNRYEGVLSVLRDGTEIVAQAKIRARRPFSHAEVSLMDYR